MELRLAGITDTAVLGVIERVPRDRFVLPAFLDRAYDNAALPIDCGQTISQPYVVAYMTQVLEVDNRHNVLEIGTGSGYQAAILSRLARRVYTVERHRPLWRAAQDLFQNLGYSNIACKLGDGGIGWKEQAPFDRIMVTCGATDIPDELMEQLAIGGIMVVPVDNDQGHQDIVRIRRNATDYEVDKLLPVRFVPLVSGVADGR